MIQTDLPGSNQELRQALYAGQIFMLPACPASRRLTEAVRALVVRVLGPDYRAAQFAVGYEDFLTRIGQLKQIVYRDRLVRALVFGIMDQYGFTAQDNALDPPRLRAVLHNGHADRGARAAYSAHRDTWYANPQCQINWWMPIHDVGERESFLFFPHWFDKAIENSSAAFDYDVWSVEIGFGRSYKGDAANYPQPTFWSGEGEQALEFACHKGEIILFSAAHLHQTRPNECGLTRFSVDFRTVHRADMQAGLGAPNVDNRSRGSALKDYVMPSMEAERR